MEVSDHLHAPAALRQGKEPHGTNYMGDWLGPRASLDAEEIIG